MEHVVHFYLPLCLQPFAKMAARRSVQGKKIQINSFWGEGGELDTLQWGSLFSGCSLKEIFHIATPTQLCVQFATANNNRKAHINTKKELRGRGSPHITVQTTNPSWPNRPMGERYERTSTPTHWQQQAIDRASVSRNTTQQNRSQPARKAHATTTTATRKQELRRTREKEKERESGSNRHEDNSNCSSLEGSLASSLAAKRESRERRPVIRLSTGRRELRRLVFYLKLFWVNSI